MQDTDLIKTVDTLPLDLNTNQLAQQILDENNLDKIKDLTHLFNLNQLKKNVVRIMKLNNLLDNVSDQMILRFLQRPDNFSNQDLLNYLQVTQSLIDRLNKQLGLVDETPAIQINQTNEVNVNILDGFDRDSKERIADAIKLILLRAKSENILEDTDYEEVIEGDSDEVNT